VSPAWLFAAGFARVFQVVSHGAARLQETLADLRAASAYGSEVFARGLTHLVERRVRFDAHVGKMLEEATSAKRPIADVYARVLNDAADSKKMTEALEHAMSRPASRYDSHLRPVDRIAWVSKIAAPAPTEGQDEATEAWSLLGDREAVARRMTDEVQRNGYRRRR